LALALTLLALLTSLVISGVCTSSGGSSPGGGVTTWGVISGGGNLQGGNLRHSCRTVINRRRRIASSFATFSADKEQAQRPTTVKSAVQTVTKSSDRRSATPCSTMRSKFISAALQRHRERIRMLQLLWSARRRNNRPCRRRNAWPRTRAP